MGAIHRLATSDVVNADKPGRYPDGGGLYLQVSQSGDRITKSWAFRFMLDGRARQMGLGPVGDISLPDAREQARQARLMLREGVDPIENRLARRDERRAQKAETVTFKQAAERFLEVHQREWKNAKHRQQWRSSLEAYAFPILGTRPVSAIDAKLINDTVAPIWQAKPETASRVKQRIERIVAWVKTGMPLPAPSKTRRVRHHPALPYAELPGFMAQLRARASVSARALEITILTAARTSETIGARWSEIDLDHRIWSIPADRMKGGKAHRVPLSDRAIEILRALPREGEYLFPGAKAQKPISNMSMLELLRGMLGGGCTVHGFRSSFRDWAKEQTAFPREICELALAHVVKDGAERAYSRGDALERRRPLMAAWSRFCEQMPDSKGATVTALHRSA